MTMIKDFKEGDHLDGIKLLVSGCTRGITQSGAPYLNLILQDSSKTIDAKLWDVKPEIEKLIESGKVYEFTLEINNYRGKLQAKVINVLPVNQLEINLNDFLSSSPVSKEDLRNGIEKAVNSIKNKNIAMIVTSLLKYYDNKFYEYPAASKIHHNFVGGLATHTNGMLKIANAICDIYAQVNRDYLIAGVILHDLGKIEELTSAIVTEYTTKGKLLGHISIIDARLLQIGNEINLADSEELLILRHMVLSHHGEYEFGSPVRPETLEAEILSYIDNIDAKINILDKALNDVNEGEFTDKIFALENRVFYKHK